MKPLKFLYYSIAAIALLVTIYTDLTYSEPMPPDMRNRIVGARMMEDGLSPYFYVWQKGGPVRYYDIHTAPNANVSRATATPFFHWLLMPIADLPQSELNTIWMFIEYAALLACAVLALFSLQNGQKRFALPVVTALITVVIYTVGWRIHVYGGQNYIFIPLLAFGCFYFLKASTKWPNVLLFSIFAASLILVYPATMFLFTPFVFYIKQYFKYALTTVALLAVYVVLVVLNPVQKNNWDDYFKALPIHANNHVGNIKLPEVDYDPVPIKQFEGINLADIPNAERTGKLAASSQYSNFYYYYAGLTHKSISIPAMMCVGVVVCIFILLPLLLFVQRKIPITQEALFITGFIVFNMFNFFGPIIRCDYHFVTFLFPLLLLVVWLRKIYIIPFILLALGLYMNITYLRIMEAQHTVGEFLIVLSLLHFVCRPLLPRRLIEDKSKVDNNVYVL